MEKKRDYKYDRSMRKGQDGVHWQRGKERMI